MSINYGNVFQGGYLNKKQQAKELEHLVSQLRANASERDLIHILGEFKEKLDAPKAKRGPNRYQQFVKAFHIYINSKDPKPLPGFKSRAYTKAIWDQYTPSEKAKFIIPDDFKKSIDSKIKKLYSGKIIRVPKVKKIDFLKKKQTSTKKVSLKKTLSLWINGLLRKQVTNNKQIIEKYR